MWYTAHADATRRVRETCATWTAAPSPGADCGAGDPSPWQTHIRPPYARVSASGLARADEGKGTGKGPIPAQTASQRRCGFCGILGCSLWNHADEVPAKFFWWRPGQQATWSTLCAMFMHVVGLAFEPGHMHPRGRRVVEPWPMRWAFTHTCWIRALAANEDDPVRLWPPCAWCGIPTDTACAGTASEPCVRAVCDDCLEWFGDVCPHCSWPNGLPSKHTPAGREATTFHI